MSQGLQNTNYAVSGSTKVSTIFVGDYAACDEGSYYTANLAATASTAVATTTQALAKTNPSLVIVNNYPVGSANSYNIYLRYVKILMTAVTTGATTAQHVGTLDNLNPKLSTVGTAFNAPNSTNSASGTKSQASLIGGVNIATGDTSQGRTIHTGTVTNSIPIVLDSWLFAYGEPVASGNNGVATVKSLTVILPPVIIAPGWTYTLGFWGASWAAAAPTYTWDCGWIERPQGQ
jgi:hypothetical protein